MQSLHFLSQTHAQTHAHTHTQSFPQVEPAAAGQWWHVALAKDATATQQNQTSQTKQTNQTNQTNQKKTNKQQKNKHQTNQTFPNYGFKPFVFVGFWFWGFVCVFGVFLCLLVSKSSFQSEVQVVVVFKEQNKYVICFKTKTLSPWLVQHLIKITPHG